MKRTSKKLFFCLMALGLLITPSLSAQTNNPYPKGFRVGFGINTGLPTNATYDAALGLDARLQYDLTQKTSITATTGYTHLFDSDGDLGLVPAKLGFKSFLNKNIYLQGELGAGFGTHSEMGNTLIWSPAVGYANKYIDVNIHYERYNDYQTDQFGIRIAYGFSLKKLNKKK
ncbi:hypothetical protein [Flavobacterium sp. HSC-61S13]|uniref:hypothetical protein n=1 Tax=Flavobacterium sp. HSC-61S13 TaxID=2910963 RepID=UPI00209CFB3C|nr:hypothetical protein [Flavobacterium sp. HSC-61S13]MCP1995798.1 opacity protein-like surface antigen [Flavobacterium sp. HSC-61S13]